MSGVNDVRISSGPCLIVGGGSLDMEWANAYVQELGSAMTIACDSGISFFYHNGYACPDLFVGDYDSADPEMVAFYAEKEQTLKVQLPVRKDLTDSEKALITALEAGCDPIHLIGMTGGRLDHTLGNIQMLRRAADAGVHAYLADPHSRALMVSAASSGGDTESASSGRTFTLHRDKAYGSYFSLIAVGGPVRNLTIAGAQFPVEDVCLPGTSTLGISNAFAQDEVHISFDSGVLLVVESRD